MIPMMTDPLGQHWKQPKDIREAPMDSTHVLLTSQQIDGLLDYSSSLQSGTYDGKCWKRINGNVQYLCWYEPCGLNDRIGIGHRIILDVEITAKRQGMSDANR